MTFFFSKKFSTVVTLLSVLAVLLAGTVWAQAAGNAPGRGAAPQAATGSAFTYQGRLDKNGSGVTGACDFQFSLYDAPSNGTQVGATVTKTGVSVTDGLFTTELDFGGNAFDGEARYLQIAVKCSGDAGYTTLSGRVAINGTPYALGLRSGITVEGSESGRVFGAINTDSSGSNAALYGEATSALGAGVSGWNTGSSSGYGVYGNNSAGSGTPYGIYGIASDTGSATSYGVYGKSNSSVGTGVGGIAPTNGVYGEASNNSGTTWGVYGKSNSPNGYGVYSNGNAHVEGSLTWQAVVSYITIPAAAFKPSLNGYSFSNYGNTLTPGDATSSGYVAGVNLPNGANISNLTFYWTDGATDDGHVSLYRTDLDGNEILMASASTHGGGPGDSVTGSSGPSTISYPLIDNSSHSYYIWASLPLDADGAVSLYGVVIEYTIEHPY